MIGLGDVTGFVVNAVSQPINYGWVIFGVILIFVILFSMKHFLDIALDLWKLPFAVIVDAIDLLAYQNPIFDLAAAAGAFVLFWVFARRGHHLSKVFAIITVVEALIGVWIFPQYAFITNLFPLATLLMFVSIWKE
ncbi:MAG TPA: hypothetical protein VJI68_01680 [Candidatus Nanoarchaeia archaeon]|nr:hypothetical protein [Candidatus Nanoarchaeia archaeon]